MRRRRAAMGSYIFGYEFLVGGIQHLSNRQRLKWLRIAVWSILVDKFYVFVCQRQKSTKQTSVCEVTRTLKSRKCNKSNAKWFGQ